jgi:hypothetical protein
MNQVNVNLFLAIAMLWVVFAVIAGMMVPAWRSRLLWLPVQLGRRAVAATLRALADFIGGKKK